MGDYKSPDVYQGPATSALPSSLLDVTATMTAPAALAFQLVDGPEVDPSKYQNSWMSIKDR